jgi:two-component system sensor histidine kinase KdpD
MTSLDAGVIRARKEWQPLEEVIGVALNRLDDSLGGRSVRITIAPEANLAPFDATLIEQVFINLVENAIRHTPSNSPIEISVLEIQGGVEVTVADRGPGVQPGQEEQIFEKFRRAAPNTLGGMGLGLAICRGFLTVHGGRIWCENRPDGGASFHFVLPREDKAPPMNPLPEAIAEV